MNDQSDANKRIAKNSIFMSIRMVIVLIITLYTSRIVLKYLGVEDYGIYNVVAGFVTMFGFFNSSLSNGIQRFYNFELGKNGHTGANKVYSIAVIIQLLLVIIIVIPAELIGIWYLEHKMVIPEGRMIAAQWIFQFSLLTFILHALQVPYMAAVMAHERMDFYAVMSVTNSLLILGCAFLLPYIPSDKLVVYGVLIAIISFLVLFFYYVYCKKKFPEIKFSTKINKTLFKEMLSFSGWNVFGTFGQMLKDQGVNLILNLFFGPIVNAAKAIANQVNGGLQSFVSNLTIPVRPQLVQSYSQGNITRSLNLTYVISKFSSYLLLMISIPVILEVEYILHIWLGNNIPEYTSTFIIIILLNSIVLNLNSSVSGLVHATGEMRLYQLLGGSISIVSVLVVYIALVIKSIPGIALMTLLLMDIIRQMIALVVLKKIVKEFLLSIYLKDVMIPLLKVGISGIILPLIIHGNFEMGFIRLLLVIIASVFSISLSVYFWGLNDNEKHLLNPVFSKLKSFLIK